MVHSRQAGTKVNQVLSPNTVEFSCRDDWICAVPPNTTGQACRNGLTQHCSKDPPLEIEDSPKGVGCSFPTDESTLSYIVFYCTLHFLLLIYLKPFLEATLQLSQKKIPLLHEVIPIINILTEWLDNISGKQEYLPSVRTSAVKGLAVLNKYYAKTDELIMYRCTMSMYHPTFSLVSNYSDSTWALAVLHPKYKLSYVLSDKEMAWGVDRNSKGGLVRAMVDKLQARWSFRTCVSVIIIGSFEVVSKLMNIRSNYLCDTGWKGQLILVTWWLRHWWSLWWTGRILKYTYDFDQISQSFNVVACDWRKPTHVHGTWLFICTW